MEIQIQQMIDSYEEDKDFFGSVSDKDIEKIENSLRVTFPIEYKKFIKQYGSGGICGVNILGIEGNMGSSVLSTTERYRKLGLREDLIVIEDLGEFVICSETGKNENILYWDAIQKQEAIRYKNFNDYLKDTFKEAIDNWD